MILGAPGDPSAPLGNIGKGRLAYVHVVSRWQLSLGEQVIDPADPQFGQPAYFTLAAQGGQVRLHPSRVVAFCAEPLPLTTIASADEWFWGEGRVASLVERAQDLDEALGSFAALIKDTRNVRIGVPRLLDMVATAEGEAALMKRLQLMAQGSSVINAVVYDAGDAEGKGGETIEDRQVTWAGIPDIIRAYGEALAAAADIPMTRFWGTSAKGLNATGEGDNRDWNKMVAARQTLDVSPCLDQLDVALIPSALGSRPAEVWWKWAPLSIPTEAEETDRFAKWTEAADRVAASGALPDMAFAEVYQNTLVENGWFAGLDTALAKIPEAERFGLDPSMDPNHLDPSHADPSALQAKGGDPNLAGGGGGGSVPTRLAANDAATWLADATPRPLYVQRKLLNAADLIAWARSNGFDTTLPAGDMHVTVLYSRTPVDPMKLGRDWSEDDQGRIIVRPGGPRVIERLGENAIVLRFASPNLEWRHKEMVEAGGSHDWPEYAPHVTISYSAPAGVDIEALKPFNGELRFGPEIFETLNPDWKSTVTEE